ncbi:MULTISPECIES: HDOD domain-containing protein [Deefgea]|uniref:HDOD domain-containing protein n=1 Tax=Deefgea chitinilytica TaxID=570276 RepID=A0ABS2C8E3_9NEIS|nr:MULTISPECIES: HDOD domain-containing protein [Deefgea]MBM5570414.1 HDOD domain-containing protein [Deefgea chitinilytica]MBM9887643.1 HDOD domain-containing protein [Deefgea sp. CFH1-16]
MTTMLSEDKTSSELHDQRFAMLEDIAKELDGDTVFPICFDIAIEIGRAMKNPNASIQQIALEVQKDPLITSKIIKLANSVTYNPSGRNIVDISNAVVRLGMGTARSVALACAMDQMSRSAQLAPFEAQSKNWWLHSLKSAAIARVLCKQLAPRINPDMAFLAGLVHDLGAFFMLDRAGRYPELLERPKTVDYLVAQWHDSIGTVLLDTLGLPDEIIDAVRDNDLPRPTVTQLRKLSDVIYVANLFAGGLDEINKQDLPESFDPAELDDPQYTRLIDEMNEACAEVLNIF